MLERRRESRHLRQALESARRGSGSAVLIEGHAGIGKSRLLEEARALAGGMRVLTARGTPLEADFPFGAARQLLEGPLARVSPGERAELLAGAAAPAETLVAGSAATPSDTADRLFSVLHGCFWLVSNLAQRSPLLLCVDDAQWVDAPSLRLLSYLAERVEELPACLVVAVRPGETESADELLRALSAAPATEALRPAPLTGAGVEALVRRYRNDAETAFCTACAEVTGGNPLLIAELLGEVERQGLTPDAAAATHLRQRVPPRLSELVAGRLASLSPAAQRLATAAAILGEDADLRHAAALSGLDAPSAAEAADTLVRAGVTAPAGPAEGRLRFVHPLVATAVRGRLAGGEAGTLHRHAARILHDAGAGAARVSIHLAAAPAAGEAWAFRALVDAAARATREGAPVSAARWLARAVEEAPAREQRAEALAELGRVELALGSQQGPRRLAEAAELKTAGEERSALLLELGRAQTNAGALEEAAATLERAREAVADGTALATELDAAWVTVAQHMPRLRERARARMDELVGRHRPTTYGERVLLAAASNHAAFAAEPHERVRELALSALDDGQLLADETASGLSWTIATAALGWADDFAAAERAADAALEDARARGSIAGFATASYARSYAYLQTGRIAEAAAECRQAIDAHPDPQWTLAPFACVQLAWAELERGHPDGAEAAIESCAPDERWATAPAYMLVLEARGRVALARDRPEEALDLLLESGRRATTAGMLNPAVVSWRANAVLACLLAGDRERARTLVAEELELARRYGAPRTLAAALRSAGLAERGERSVELLGEAVKTLSASPAVLERCRALVDLGAAQRRAGTPATARETLRDALALAQRCGAVALESRAEGELMAAGARPRGRPLRGSAALTPGELRVARMAAAGMTNREIAQALFVTMKAVQFHLGNAYRKLEVAGREELSAALEIGPADH